MIGATQRGDGNASDRSRQRQVAMAEEDVADAAPVARRQPAEGGVVEQADLVERHEVYWHRIVMHEQQEWPVMLLEPRREPAETVVAVAAGMGFRERGVEEQAARQQGIMHAL